MENEIETCWGWYVKKLKYVGGGGPRGKICGGSRKNMRGGGVPGVGRSKNKNMCHTHG